MRLSGPGVLSPQMLTVVRAHCRLPVCHCRVRVQMIEPGLDLGECLAAKRRTPRSCDCDRSPRRNADGA